MRAVAAAFLLVACAAPRAPTSADPCAAGWAAFKHGDKAAAIARYSVCERMTAPPARTPTAEEPPVSPVLIETLRDAQMLEETTSREECPRTTMIEEGVDALDRLAKNDRRGFRHAMAMSCVDALVGRSAVELAIHPCVMLEAPPHANAIARDRAALEKHMPPMCAAEQSPAHGAWMCMPYGPGAHQPSPPWRDTVTLHVGRRLR
jgi:hypothetical protein